jgi:hypothetical protein
VSPVRYELGFYIPEDCILHSHSRENFGSYRKEFLGSYFPCSHLKSCLAVRNSLPPGIGMVVDIHTKVSFRICSELLVSTQHIHTIFLKAPFKYSVYKQVFGADFPRSGFLSKILLLFSLSPIHTNLARVGVLVLAVSCEQHNLWSRLCNVFHSQRYILTRPQCCVAPS